MKKILFALALLAATPCFAQNLTIVQKTPPCTAFGTASGTCAQGNDSRITGAQQAATLGQPDFKAYLSMDQTSFTTGTTIAYDSLYYNNGSAFNVSTHRFVPLTAGIYHCTAQAIVTGTALVDSTLILEILFNGAGGYGSKAETLLPAATTQALGTLVTAFDVTMNGSTDYLLVTLSFTGTVSSATVKSPSHFSCYLAAQ